MVQRQTSPELKRLIDEIYSELKQEAGYIVSGDALRRALGFSTIGAMTKAIARKKLPLPLFEMPNRRGKFIRARELAYFIACQRAKVGVQEKQ